MLPTGTAVQSTGVRNGNDFSGIDGLSHPFFWRISLPGLVDTAAIEVLCKNPAQIQVIENDDTVNTLPQDAAVKAL